MNMLPVILYLNTVFGLTIADIFGPFTDNFMRHMARKPKRNEYMLKQIEKYGDSGCFGGKVTSEEQLSNNPVIFIHGNSDSALKFGESPYQSGWNRHLETFVGHGFSMSEMYGLTYGNRNISTSYLQEFNCADVIGHRRFLEEVLLYTRSKKVSIIAHSMGVTIARAIIQGGKIELNGETCVLGKSMAHHISVFVGIAGANYGMCACEFASAFPACGKERGFYPGAFQQMPNETCKSLPLKDCPTCGDVNYGTFLQSLNRIEHREADTVVSIWSEEDEVIGLKNMAWGVKTSLIPHSTVQKVYQKLSHTELKTETSKDVLQILKQHTKHHISTHL